MRKGILLLSLVFFISFASAQIPYSKHVNLQFRDSNDNIITGNNINVTFNFSTSSDCSSPIYTNTTTVNISSSGIVTYNIPDVNIDYNQSLSLCVYRNGTLEINDTISPVPQAEFARNTTWNGILNKPSLFPFNSTNIAYLNNTQTFTAPQTINSNLTISGAGHQILAQQGTTDAPGYSFSGYPKTGFRFDSFSDNLNWQIYGVTKFTVGSISYLYSPLSLSNNLLTGVTTIQAKDLQLTQNATITDTVKAGYFGNSTDRYTIADFLSGGNSSFNQTLTDTLYSPISEPLWTANSTLVPYLADDNVFAGFNDFLNNASVNGSLTLFQPNDNTDGMILHYGINGDRDLVMQQIGHSSENLIWRFNNNVVQILTGTGVTGIKSFVPIGYQDGAKLLFGQTDDIKFSWNNAGGFLEMENSSNDDFSRVYSDGRIVYYNDANFTKININDIARLSANTTTVTCTGGEIYYDGATHFGCNSTGRFALY